MIKRIYIKPIIWYFGHRRSTLAEQLPKGLGGSGISREARRITNDGNGLQRILLEVETVHNRRSFCPLRSKRGVADKGGADLRHSGSLILTNRARWRPNTILSEPLHASFKPIQNREDRDHNPLQYGRKTSFAVQVYIIRVRIVLSVITYLKCYVLLCTTTRLEDMELNPLHYINPSVRIDCIEKEDK